MSALVAKGDITTTRGVVMSGSSTMEDEEGRTLAVDLDYATCGVCGVGPFRIYGSVSDWTDEGRNMVRDLDPVNCPCKKNFVLAKRQDYLIERGGGSSSSANTVSTSVQNTRNYDEQIRIVDDAGRPVANCPYHIKDNVGNEYQGLTDASGLCPRVHTEKANNLDIAVGLKALERWKE